MAQLEDRVNSGGSNIVSTTAAAVTLITYAAPSGNVGVEFEITAQVNDSSLFDRFVVSAMVKVVAGVPTLTGSTTIANKLTAIIANAPIVTISGSNILIQTAQAQSGTLNWSCQARVLISN